nr:hypothetical protein CFP56_31443 [Quercus suber]
MNSRVEGKEAEGNKPTKLFNIESVPDRRRSLRQLNGTYELVQRVMEEEGPLFFFFAFTHWFCNVKTSQTPPPPDPNGLRNVAEAIAL